MAKTPKRFDGTAPARRALSPAEFVELFANEARHPNALSYELRHTSLDTLTALAYAEHAPIAFLGDVPAALSEAAYDEIERRQGALRRLLTDCPQLIAALA